MEEEEDAVEVKDVVEVTEAEDEEEGILKTENKRTDPKLYASDARNLVTSHLLVR